MKKITNYEYSKRSGKPAAFYKFKSSSNGGIHVYTDNNRKMLLGHNVDVTLLDEYLIYYTSTTEKDKGSPIFVKKDGVLYLACYWGDIHNNIAKDELFEKVFTKKITAFDAIAFLDL